MCTTCMSSAYTGQKTASHLLELELKAVVNHHVGSRFIAVSVQKAILTMNHDVFERHLHMTPRHCYTHCNTLDLCTTRMKHTGLCKTPWGKDRN
ncbi:hypothetical protein STEG23_021076, partial [Scotinomys teguina]